MRTTILLLALGLLAAAPAAAAPVPALEVRLDRAEIDFGDAPRLTVTFRNASGADLVYHEPPNVDREVFPRVRFRSAGGVRYAPARPVFQVKIGLGLQGRLVRLRPGEARSYALRVDRVVRSDPATDRLQSFEPIPLPPSDYVVEASWEQADDRVPWHVGELRMERRPVPGLAVGRQDASPLALRVDPVREPRVDLSVAGTTPPRLRVVLVNPGLGEHLFAGRPRLTLSGKPHGTFTAEPAIGAGGGIRVSAGGRAEFTVDLRTLGWRSDAGALLGLGEAVPNGLGRARLQWGTPEAHLVSEDVWLTVPEVPAHGLAGLEVRASVDADRLRVHLRNGGDAALRLFAEPALDRHLLVVVRTAGASTGLRGPGRPGPGSAPGREDVRSLEPGASLFASVPLLELVSGGLPPGRYEVFAGYENRETGVRLGLPAGKRPGTGTVWSEPVILEVR